MVESLVLHLMTLMELVAYTRIIHLAKLHYLESIVMPIDFHSIADYVLQTVVVAQDFDLVDDSVLARA